MDISTTRRLRWAVPVGALALVASVTVIPGVAASAARPALPDRTAAQLLASMGDVAAPSLSGTVSQTARLGLPELPSMGGSSTALTWTNLLTGSHTAKVWVDGMTRQRVALLGDLAESDVIRNGRDLWTYSSSTNEATHRVLPSNTAKPSFKPTQPQMPMTPLEAATQALAAVGPTTTVTVDGTAQVAGRAAYQISLQPKDDRSLVTAVTMAVDAETDTPLRVQVWARGSQLPAFETGFTQVRFATPDPAVFDFTPPQGAEVRKQTVPPMGQLTPRLPGDGPMGRAQGADPAAKDAMTVLGDGWTSVVVAKGVSLSALSGGGSDGGQLLGLLTKAATPVAQGQLLQTALVTVLLTDDGTLYAGAVTPAALQQVAATGKAL